jgi:hypothetical protein
MCNIEHLIEYSHVNHNTIHAVVIIARENHLSDSFENKKCLLAGEIIID